MNNVQPANDNPDNNSNDIAENNTRLLSSAELKAVIVRARFQQDAKGNFMFDNVPFGQQATLLAFYVSKDKKNALFGYKEITLGKTKTEEVELKEMSADALKNMFADVFPQ